MLKNRFTMRNRALAAVAATTLAVGALAAGCGGDDDSSNGATDGGGEGLSGTVTLDGSSTVAPLSESAAELFQDANPGVRVTVGTSGTGGGFEKFCRGEIDISNASRPITDEEMAACEAAGIAYEEVNVANDALSVVVNNENDWASCLTVEQLSEIWRPGSQIDNWNQVDPSFPDMELELFGPGTDSGTFDYFTDAINGEEGAQRTDYNNIGEDDNAAVTGVQGTEGGMAYFGYSFFAENEGNVKAVEIDGGDGCVAPSAETAQDGSYTPLGRQLFVYPSDQALAKPEVQAFLEFYINESEAIAERAAIIPLTEEQQQESLAKVNSLAGAE